MYIRPLKTKYNLQLQRFGSLQKSLVSCPAINLSFRKNSPYRTTYDSYSFKKSLPCDQGIKSLEAFSLSTFARWTPTRDQPAMMKINAVEEGGRKSSLKEKSSSESVDDFFAETSLHGWKYTRSNSKASK